MGLILEYQYSDHRLPAEITGVLRVLDRSGFFSDGLLIGSWAMLFYQEALGFRYASAPQSMQDKIQDGLNKKGIRISWLKLIKTGLL